MFRGKKKLNSKGFSLVEILIAVGILALIIVPLAMNMVSSTQINSTAKQVSASSDLTGTIMESLQTVDLSDIMADVNGYSSDEYGTQFTYLLTEDALDYFYLGKAQEVLYDSTTGKYGTVKKLGDPGIILDRDVTASTTIRNTGNVTRTYFTGQPGDKYSFLLSSVKEDRDNDDMPDENNELNVDVLTVIEPEKSFDIVNITSMAQTELISVQQDKDMDRLVSEEFERRSRAYSILQNHTTTAQSASWFLDRMEKTIIVNIQQDMLTEAATVVIEAEYKINIGKYDPNCMRDTETVVRKTLGSFSTNSTSEFSRGVYVYYYPLANAGNSARDHFVVNNKNNLYVPVYLIGLISKTVTDFGSEDNEWKMSNYTPDIEVVEHINSIGEIRATICSNVHNVNWVKSSYPLGTDYKIKTLANISEQQTLYSANIYVYKHNDDSYDASGAFKPREKDLITVVEGTFIDTSERLDIDSDKTAGLTPTDPIATAGAYAREYTGQPQLGVHGTNVVWGNTASDTKYATDAGTYKITVRPADGYYWRDGSTSTKTITWKIKPQPSADYEANNFVYDKTPHKGVVVDDTKVFVEGIKEEINAGTYQVTLTPKKNYAWRDGTTTQKTVYWKIDPKPVDVVWDTGLNKDLWIYDGITHSGKWYLGKIVDGSFVSDIITGDICTAYEKDNYIKEIGIKDAKLTGLSNSNYILSGEGISHKISVQAAGAATITIKDPSQLVYDGTWKSVVATSNGVYFSGDDLKKDAGKYVLKVHVLPGFEWPDTTTNPYTGEPGTDRPIEIEWEITQRQIGVQWSEDKVWTYDGKWHSITATATNVVSGDTVNIELKDDQIKEVGKKTAKTVSLDNPNYCLPNPKPTQEIEVIYKNSATYKDYDYTYDGNPHTGVVYKYAKVISGNCSATNVNFDGDVPIEYTVQLKPLENYSWAPGTKDNYGDDVSGTDKTIDVKWWIHPLEDAWYVYSDSAWCNKIVNGVVLYNAQKDTSKTNNILSAKDVGNYTAYIEPLPNHVWKRDMYVGTVQQKDKNGNLMYDDDGDPIYEQAVDENGRLLYDDYNVPIYKEQKLISKAGTKGTRKIKWSIIENLYQKPDLLVKNYVYNGKEQSPIFNTAFYSEGFNIRADSQTSGKNVDTYKIYLELKNPENTTWADGSTDVIELEWKIIPKPVSISSTYNPSNNVFTYDGSQHVATVPIAGLCAGDTCKFTYENNKHYLVRSVGDTVDTIMNDPTSIRSDNDDYVFKITGVDNPNYTIEDVQTYLVESDPGGDYEYSYVEDEGGATLNGLSEAERHHVMRINPAEFGITWGTLTFYYYDGTPKTVNPIPTESTLYKLQDSRHSCYGKYGIDLTKVNVVNNVRTIADKQNVTVKGLLGDLKGCYKTPSSNVAEMYVVHAPLAWIATYDQGYVYNGGTKYASYDGKYVNWSSSSTYSASNAGTYYLYATPQANYAWSDGGLGQRSVSWYIDKGTAYITQSPSGNNWIYDGVTRSLVNAGYANTEMEYSTGGSYSTTIPTGKDAGARTVYYRAAGNSNYYPSASSSITVNVWNSPKANVVWDTYVTFKRGQTARCSPLYEYCSYSGGSEQTTTPGSKTFYAKANTNYCFSGTTGTTKTCPWTAVLQE